MAHHCKPYRLLCGASVNATVLKASSAALLHGIFVGSLNDAPIYIYIYDSASTPDANATPVAQFLCPANATPANGAGSNIPFPTALGGFVNGIAVRVTKNITSTGTTATDADEIPITFLVS